MANTELTARAWVAVLANRTELPFGSNLREHFSRARITSLCDCGCNSFECKVEPDSSLHPLFDRIGPLPSFEAAFETNTQEPVDVIFFTDANGYLSGIDISLGLSNHAPVPEQVQLGKLLYTMPDL
ncbi:MAG: hypothetical protein AB3X41_11870 [Leptothrix ochracea]|uniref:hypothetical protein n=1 Tax=Leptothrix ochracea TaxID=735331 RepID=UPI0034E1EACB